MGWFEDMAQGALEGFGMGGQAGAVTGAFGGLVGGRRGGRRPRRRGIPHKVMSDVLAIKASLGPTAAKEVLLMLLAKG